MKHILLLIVSTAFILSSCNRDHKEIAINTKSRGKAIRALKKIEDSTMILQVALQAKYNDINVLAMDRLSQYRLKKLALEHEDSYFKRYAVEKITDQTFLARLALYDKDIVVSGEALNNIKRTFFYPAEPDRDLNIAIRIRNAIEVIPNGYSERNRIVDSLLPAIQFLNEPEIREFVGDIDSIQMFYQDISETYHYANTPGSGVTGIKHGEVFAIKMIFNKTGLTIAEEWKSALPYITSDYSFLPADITSGELLKSLFDILPESLLAKATLNENRSIREYALKESGSHR
jgi:hypothetical protein